ncbi:unnamed protein product [Rotaria sp. Silwood2]|nr:unnamed protein product [Rotaria sp. Silwood2]
MNKVKPKVLLLCSIITIGNSRLEELALDKCHLIDLTFDYFQSSHEIFIQRFYSHVMPRISNCIRSLILNIEHLPKMISFAENECNGFLPNLTHLKIILNKQSRETGTSYGLGIHLYNVLHVNPLFSFIPQFVRVKNFVGGKSLFNLRYSSFMRSIVWFELDDDCILPNVFNDDRLFFPQSIQLTHIRITLYEFPDCVHLLNQMGTQICSFSVTILCVDRSEVDIISKIRSISCLYLKQFTITIYRNIIEYERCIVPLLQRLSNVEYLTLLLAIGFTGNRPDHFIDGFDLKKDIISYMHHLRQFNFHIRSILQNAPRMNIDTIRQSFIKHQQCVDCSIEYFNNNYGQCHIYSLPFIGTRLDFISNRFPLFDTNNTFSMVTILILYDDVKPFENVFFEHLVRALPHLKSLEIVNELEQQEKTISITNKLEYAHLTSLMLFKIHMDYAEQLLCRTSLPSLNELIIHNDILLTIINQNQQQARENCSRVKTLRTSHPLDGLVNVVRNFFPSGSYIKYPSVG